MFISSTSRATNASCSGKATHCAYRALTKRAHITKLERYAKANSSNDIVWWAQGTNASAAGSGSNRKEMQLRARLDVLKGLLRLGSGSANCVLGPARPAAVTIRKGRVCPIRRHRFLLKDIGMGRPDGSSR